MVTKENYISQKKIALLICLSLGTWILGIFLTPIFAASESSSLNKIASFLYFFFQPVCHQIADRSFMLDGYPLTVCIRCVSFYLGGFVVISIYLLKDMIKMWNISIYSFMVAPVALDFMLEKFDYYSNIVGLRILTGLLLGIAIFHLLLVSLITDAPSSAMIPVPKKGSRSGTKG